MNILNLPIEMSSYQVQLQRASSPFLVLLGFLVVNMLSWPIAAYTIIWFAQLLLSQVDSHLIGSAVQLSAGLVAFCVPVFVLYSGWMLIKGYCNEVTDRQARSTNF